MASNSAAASQAMHKQSRVLACVLCQHRKIKCDRNTPCSNCLKANVTCTPSTPAPARKRRRPNQDLQERLARCEDLLKQYAGAPNPSGGPRASNTKDVPQPLTPNATESQADTAPASSATTTPANSNDTFSQWKPTGKMIKQDGNDRFMDSYLWASVYDELRAIKDIVDTDEPEDSSIIGSEDQTPENNADLFFPGESSSTSVEDLQPDPIHAFRLWQLFLDRVNPLIKIVHVPSLQPYILEGATHISGVPLQYQGLLFAIYAMGTVSLSEIEAMQMLGMSRDAALSRFATGIKVSLVRFNFLKNHDMVVLQALVLYLIALQGRYDRHAAWVLSGTIVRIAQKMGYHRDGEFLNLPPFETEMRRRIWWQIIMQDAKYAMASGLSHSLLPVHWDTRAPLNVNDADLFPESSEPIQPREGPTEMAFCLMIFEIIKFLIFTASSQAGFEAALMGQEVDPPRPDAPQSKGSLQRFRDMVDQLEDSMKEVETRHVDASAGNVHGAALTIRPMMSKKLKELLIPMREQPEWGIEVFGPKDKLFKIVLLNVEQNTENYEFMAEKGFLWFVKLHFQLDAFGVMTVRLIQRPTGTLADRAWTVMEKIYVYHPELFDLTQKANLAQAQFTVRAWRAREQAFAQAGLPIEAPQFVVRLRDGMPSHDSTRSCSTNVSSNTPPSATQQPQPVTELDQFLGGYLDVSGLNWNMWGDVSGGDSTQISQALLSSFDIGTMGGM